MFTLLSRTEQKVIHQHMVCSLLSQEIRSLIPCCITLLFYRGQNSGYLSFFTKEIELPICMELCVSKYMHIIAHY